MFFEVITDRLISRKVEPFDNIPLGVSRGSHRRANISSGHSTLNNPKDRLQMVEY